MPRYEIEYTIRGKLHIDANSAEEAHDKFSDKEFDETVAQSESVDREMDDIQILPDYNE
jgi:hypothetical protein